MSKEPKTLNVDDRLDGLPLKLRVPNQGWRQILSPRQRILSGFDRAREQARLHEVETFHGENLEAHIRGWLGEFLPERYGVTSGYVVSPGLPDGAKLPHFDVIVYDRLESPTLWVEDTPDRSVVGARRALPVEHVLAVLEVKSSLEPSTVRAGIEHLADLRPLLSGLDASERSYKMYLPRNFVCGLVFGELRPAFERSSVALSAFLEGRALRGFMGGLVLRAVNAASPLKSGRVQLLYGDEPIAVDAASPLLTRMALSEFVAQQDGTFAGAMIQFAEMQFSAFAFDLLAMLRGEYMPGRASTWYGLGYEPRDR